VLRGDSWCCNGGLDYLIVVNVVWSFTLILNNHIVQNGTCMYDHTEYMAVNGTTWGSYNMQSSLEHHKCSLLTSFHASSWHAANYLSAFRTRGVPGPTSKLSPRAPAQMGRSETEREGGKKPEGDRRERWNPRPSCLSRAQVGCACSRGLQASTQEGASGLARAPSCPSPRGQPSVRGPWIFLL
jgi:hypothetical protein